MSTLNKEELNVFEINGIRFRQVKGTLETIMFLFFSKYKFGRWMLGGKWQGILHDAGTKQEIRTWHWMEEFLKDKDSIKENYDH